MNKKILGIGLTVLVLSALVFTVGGSVFAQEGTPEVQATELPAPVVTRYGHGFGPGDGTCPGTCDADGDGVPDQLRLRDGSGTGMQYGNSFGPGDGVCDGTCDADGDGVPDQLRLRDGSGTGMQYGPGAMQGGRGQGMGQGMGQGFGTAEGQGFGPTSSDWWKTSVC